MQDVMSDWTKVLLVNVVLATAAVVSIFHAPVASAALGAVGAAVVLWLWRRLDRRRR